MGELNLCFCTMCYKSNLFTESQGSYNAQSFTVCNDKPIHITVLLQTYPISLIGIVYFSISYQVHRYFEQKFKLYCKFYKGWKNMRKDKRDLKVCEHSGYRYKANPYAYVKRCMAGGMGIYS